MFDVIRKKSTFVLFLTVFFGQIDCYATEEKFTILGNEHQAELDWLDELQLDVSNTLFLSASWFDSFFTDDDAQQSPPQTTARIRLGWEPKAGDLSKFKAKFRVRLNLPHFENKLDLILSDDEQDNINLFPIQSVNTEQNLKEDSFAAAVRLVHERTLESLTDTRVGISSGDIFVRSRYRKHYLLTNNFGFRVEPAIHYYMNDGLGARFLAEFEYQKGLQEQWRFNYTIHGSESFSGIRWKHGFYHLKQFSLKEAAIAGIVIEGERNGENGFLIENYTLSYRYRFNALREWLFFDIEPFLEWPEERNYHTVPGIALRVEGYFSKN